MATVAVLSDPLVFLRGLCERRFDFRALFVYAPNLRYVGYCIAGHKRKSTKDIIQGEQKRIQAE